MRTIPLTREEVALVDDEDYENLIDLKWATQKNAKTSYAIHVFAPNGCKKTTLYMHRSILGAKKGEEIDHIDGNGLNNQKSNLRFVTRRQNQQNRHCIKSSRFVGVTWNKRACRWQAQITVGRRNERCRNKNLGCFSTEEEAHQQYVKACEQLIGGN